jgi:acetyl esterase/lipase
MICMIEQGAALTAARRERLKGMRVLTAGIMLTVAGCGGAGRPLSTAASDTTASDTIVRTRLDVPYATASGAHRLDLYVPPTGDGPFPLIVWIHGGGFSGGNKSLSPGAPARQLTNRGFAVATLEYRLSGEARFPAAVLDLKAAIRYLRANAPAYRLDPGRIGAWGSSAGGHLAAFLGVTGGVSEFEDSSLGNPAQSSRVQAVVDWYGPSEILQMDVDGNAQGCPLYGGAGHDSPSSPEARWLGATPSSVPDLARKASPVAWVSADDPPFMIQHGGSDCTVPTGQGRRMRDALLPVLGAERVTWTEFPTDGHGGPGFTAATNLDLITAFFSRYLR